MGAKDQEVSSRREDGMDRVSTTTKRRRVFVVVVVVDLGNGPLGDAKSKSNGKERQSRPLHLKDISHPQEQSRQIPGC